MRGNDMLFLPVFNMPMGAEQQLSWNQRVRAFWYTLNHSRKAQVLFSSALTALILIGCWLFWPKQVELYLPSPTFQEAQANWSTLTHLVILPGHAIQWCSQVGKSLNDESCWYLQPFQHGQVPIFLAHIRKAIEEAANDPKSLLIMSGGQTRPGVGLRSEAESYFTAAEQLGYFEDFDGTNVFDRTVSESFARDSLENLMFSVCRFKQIVGHYPRKITVVGFPFKAARFIDLHRKAINFPLENFKYISVQVHGHHQDEIVDDAYTDFQGDLYGCGKKLAEKRRSRNPYKNLHAYRESCPDMLPYFDACGSENL